MLNDLVKFSVLFSETPLSSGGGLVLAVEWQFACKTQSTILFTIDILQFVLFSQKNFLGIVLLKVLSGLHNSFHRNVLRGINSEIQGESIELVINRVTSKLNCWSLWAYSRISILTLVFRVRHVWPLKVVYHSQW